MPNQDFGSLADGATFAPIQPSQCEVKNCETPHYHIAKLPTGREIKLCANHANREGVLKVLTGAPK